jgi:intraflagellar transport protein 88
LHPHPLRLEEEARSLSYYQEAHRAWPVNLDVISWLGAFHVRNEVSEAAPAWAQGDVVVG